MNIEGVAEKPVVAASESLCERLVHGPGRGIVEKYRDDDKAIEEPDLQMIRNKCRRLPNVVELLNSRPSCCAPYLIKTIHTTDQTGSQILEVKEEPS